MPLSKEEALQAAIRRLRADSPERSYLEKELFQTKAGIRGEERLQKKFIEFYYPDGFEIIWNNHLMLGEWPVQMDGLLLTQKAAVIIESKNISGELHFHNETGEFCRIDESGVRTVMDNPAIQVEKHMRFLKSWLHRHGINLAVDGLLVFTAKQCELKTLPQNIRTCKLHHMTEKIFHLLKEYNPPAYSPTSLTQIKNLILASQTPFLPKPIATHYSINPDQLAKGIYCTQCETHTVKRSLRAWRCANCGISDDGAAAKAILEYFALFGSHPTNRDIRDFLGINDRHLVKRLLAAADLQKTGRSRKTRYVLKS